MLYYTNETFINVEQSRSKLYNKYTIVDDKNEYLLVSYGSLDVELKKDIITGIKNKKFNINTDVFNLNDQEQLIKLNLNITQQYDYIFAINKSDIKKLINESIIVFDENNYPKYLNFANTLQNIIEPYTMEGQEKSNAQLFIDKDYNYVVTDIKNQINKNTGLNLITSETIKKMSNNISLELINNATELINKTPIYKINLSATPTKFSIKEKIMSI